MEAAIYNNHQIDFTGQLRAKQKKTYLIYFKQFVENFSLLSYVNIVV